MLICLPMNTSLESGDKPFEWGGGGSQTLLIRIKFTIWEGNIDNSE